jgi:hypothetical protein
MNDFLFRGYWILLLVFILMHPTASFVSALLMSTVANIAGSGKQN